MSKRTRSNKNLKFIIGGALLLLLVLALIVQAAVSTGAYYMTVGEVQSSAPSLLGERIRVNDAVVANSEEWNAQEIILKFSITDEGVTDQVIDSGTSLAELPVIFYGPRPDNFQRAVSAIVEGSCSRTDPSRQILCC